MSQATARQSDLYPTKGYKPSPTSQIPGLFIAPLKEAIHKDVFKNLSANVRLLYLLLHDYVKWSEKQQVKSGNSYIKGKTIRVKAQRIKDEHFPHDTVGSVRKWLRELEAVNLIARKSGSGNIPHFLITDYLSPSATREFEDNATKRDQAIAEIAAEKAVTKSDFRPSVISKDTSDVALGQPLLFKKETKETSSSSVNQATGEGVSQTPSSSSDAEISISSKAYALWCDRHKRFGNCPRGAFFKGLKTYQEKARNEWGLDSEASERVLIASIPSMPDSFEGGQIYSPAWLNCHKDNYQYLQEGLKAEGVEIGQGVSEVGVQNGQGVSEVKTANDAEVATKPKPKREIKNWNLLDPSVNEGKTMTLNDSLRKGGVTLTAREFLDNLRK